MSPNGKAPGGGASSNVYTILLALAFGIVLATAAFVAYKCNLQYGTIFSVP